MAVKSREEQALTLTQTLRGLLTLTLTLTRRGANPDTNFALLYSTQVVCFGLEDGSEVTYAYVCVYVDDR